MVRRKRSWLAHCDVKKAISAVIAAFENCLLTFAQEVGAILTRGGCRRRCWKHGEVSKCPERYDTSTTKMTLN